MDRNTRNHERQIRQKSSKGKQIKQQYNRIFHYGWECESEKEKDNDTDNIFL